MANTPSLFLVVILYIFSDQEQSNKRVNAVTRVTTTCLI